MNQFYAESYFENRIALAGELPLAIGQLKANGCSVNLYGNQGFTLSSDISAVADATMLDFRECYLSGACFVEPSIPPPRKPILTEAKFKHSLAHTTSAVPPFTDKEHAEAELKEKLPVDCTIYI